MFKPASNEKRLEWQERIQTQRESGLSIAQWCKENQIPTHVFYYWKSRLFPKTLQRDSFTELRNAKDTGVVIKCGAIQIHIDNCFDPSTLKQCLELLTEIKC